MGKIMNLKLAQNELKMIEGLLRMADKGVFSGVNGENVDWLVTNYLSNGYMVDKELTQKVEDLKENVRSSLDALIQLQILIARKMEDEEDQQG